MFAQLIFLIHMHSLVDVFFFYYLHISFFNFVKLPYFVNWLGCIRANLHYRFSIILALPLYIFRGILSFSSYSIFITRLDFRFHRFLIKQLELFTELYRYITIVPSCYLYLPRVILSNIWSNCNQLFGDVPGAHTNWTSHYQIDRVNFYDLIGETAPVLLHAAGRPI